MAKRRPRLQNLTTTDKTEEREKADARADEKPLHIRHTAPPRSAAAGPQARTQAQKPETNGKAETKRKKTGKKKLQQTWKRSSRSPGGPPHRPPSPTPRTRITHCSSTPAGMRTATLRATRTRPSPPHLHAWQACMCMCDQAGWLVSCARVGVWQARDLET